MMDDLIRGLTQKTGLSPDKAQEVVNFVVNHLKTNLPEPLSSSLDSYWAGGSEEGGGLADKAKGVASGLGGLFGKKSE